MSIESDLVTYLASKASVTAIVGTPNPRIYGVKLPQKLRSETRLPAIIYRRRTGGREHDLTGGAGTAMPAIQLSSCAETYAGASALAEVLRNVLQGVGPATWASTTAIQSVVLDDQSDDFVPYDDGSDDGVFVVSQMYRIRHVEAAATL